MEEQRSEEHETISNKLQIVQKSFDSYRASKAQETAQLEKRLQKHLSSGATELAIQKGTVIEN